MLYLIQPAARLWGRVSYGLTPWRRRARHRVALPRPRTLKVWSERWASHDERLRAVEWRLREQGVPVRPGGAYDDWDLQVRGGLLACVRVRLGVEEYPGGRQYLRFRSWPCLGQAVYAAVVPGALAVEAAVQHAGWASAALGALAGMVVLRTLGDYAAALGCVRAAVEGYGEGIAAGAAGEDSPVPDPLDSLGEPKRDRRDRPGLEAGMACLDMLDLPVRGVRVDAREEVERPPGAGVLDGAVDEMDGPAAVPAGDVS
jgi:hypothetical protein